MKPAEAAPAEAARAEVINIVNNFFYQRLTALPSIRAYIDHCREEHEARQAD